MFRRSWPILINLLQTEGKNGFGTQFHPIPQFKNIDKPSALTWTLFGLISSCSELWHIIDSKPRPFRWSGWEGWVLASIQKLCFEFDSVCSDKNSPIKAITSVSDIVSKVNVFAAAELDGYDIDRDSYTFYRFNIGCFQNIFNPMDYNNSVAVLPSINYFNIPENMLEVTSKKIIIVVGHDAPNEGCHIIYGVEFEL